MWIIVGLGNPGRKYKNTRHNAGFLALNELIRRHSIEMEKSDLFEIGNADIENRQCTIIMPLTYMNRSGKVVVDYYKEHHPNNFDLIVIHDDIDMETGRIKIKKSGSSGGHRGIQSIIDSIGTPEFIRIKIGIGRDPLISPSEYVLQEFNNDEIEDIKTAISLAGDAVEIILSHSVDKAMNIFN